MAEDHLVNLVTSHGLVCISQTVLYFTDRHFTDWLVEFESIKYQYEIFYLISDVNIDNGTKFC